VYSGTTYIMLKTDNPGSSVDVTIWVLPEQIDELVGMLLLAKVNFYQVKEQREAPWTQPAESGGTASPQPAQGSLSAALRHDLPDDPTPGSSEGAERSSERPSPFKSGCIDSSTEGGGHDEYPSATG